LFFWLILGTLQWMFWGVYKKTVAGVTASLAEVGPDLKNQLTACSPQQRRLQRVALGLALACVGVLVLILFAVSARPPSPAMRRPPAEVCPPSQGTDDPTPVRGTLPSS
jgi:hypothetical protein